MTVHANNIQERVKLFRTYAIAMLATGIAAETAAREAAAMVDLDQNFTAHLEARQRKSRLLNGVSNCIDTMMSRRVQFGRVENEFAALDWDADEVQIDVDDFRAAGTVSCNLRLTGDWSDIIAAAPEVVSWISERLGIDPALITNPAVNPLLDSDAFEFSFSIDAPWHGRLVAEAS